MKLFKLYEWEGPQLFGLSKDISEANDLWDKMPAKAEKIHDTLQAFLREVNAPMPIYNPDWDMTPNEWLVWSKERKAPKKKARKADKNSKRK